MSSLSRKTIEILDVPIDCVDWPGVLEKVYGWSLERRGRYICIVNAHSLVTAKTNSNFKKVLTQADMSTPDGAPVAWLMRFFGVVGQNRINGPDLMWKYCELLNNKEESIFLYGGANRTVELLMATLSKEFPGLRVAGHYSPPFGLDSSQVDDYAVGLINESGAGTVWVCLGCPRQEVWMATHKNSVNAVMIGVGAAFDYHAGVISRAPLWMRSSGLEWLHRLFSEPRRLWRRYFITNSLFIIFAVKNIIFRKSR